jgi:hypothetical protein
MGLVLVVQKDNLALLPQRHAHHRRRRRRRRQQCGRGRGRGRPGSVWAPTKSRVVVIRAQAGARPFG